VTPSFRYASIVGDSAATPHALVAHGRSCNPPHVEDEPPERRRFAREIAANHLHGAVRRRAQQLWHDDARAGVTVVDDAEDALAERENVRHLTRSARQEQHDLLALREPGRAGHHAQVRPHLPTGHAHDDRIAGAALQRSLDVDREHRFDAAPAFGPLGLERGDASEHDGVRLRDERLEIRGHVDDRVEARREREKDSGHQAEEKAAHHWNEE
jgi:hypothetical protein